MWTGDSDGVELPDRRQVAATQGPSAAVTRRDPSPFTPHLPQSSGPELRPFSCPPAGVSQVLAAGVVSG